MVSDYIQVLLDSLLKQSIEKLLAKSNEDKGIPESLTDYID